MHDLVAVTQLTLLKNAYLISKNKKKKKKKKKKKHRLKTYLFPSLARHPLHDHPQYKS